MTVLALDIGTKTGWAISLKNGTISGNAKWPKSKRKKNPQHVGHRFNEFKKMLTELKNKYDVTSVYYERSYFGAKGKIAEEVRNQFVGVLLCWACHHDLPVEPISTSTLRASYGNRFKRDAGKLYAETCANRFSGRSITSDDEADALMLLRHVTRDIELGLQKHQVLCHTGSGDDK